jgi:hypothetical protein
MEQSATCKDDRGDLLNCGFWARGTGCIPDVWATDTDAISYSKLTPVKVLESQEKDKKHNYLNAACLERHHHFTPFVCSVDGMLGWEARAFAKCLAATLMNKWQKTYSQVYRYVNATILRFGF